MKRRKFWACYLSVIAFVLGGVYIATANLDSIPLLQFSSVEMQQLVGAYEENAHCEYTDGCYEFTCWETPAHIVTTSYLVERCRDGGSWCEDASGLEYRMSCETLVYDQNCQNPDGPYYTYTYGCSDGS